ncbi:MAG: 3-deoxy-7-phosphoheptulonate synthase [Polyangiaceae bacterium]|nr:3-deoxy-7-phosphoheptulonate synthase [Polyangiaceae bacterium]
MFSPTDDVRIESLHPLLPPAILMEELPLGDVEASLVARSRSDAAKIIQRTDDRLLVVVGPCSIHDPEAGLDYADRLKRAQERVSDELLIVMRTYFEKPRTTVGWKGLINDPDLDGTFRINRGLRVARKFLLDVLAVGLPTGTEFLDPISPQFVADLVSWGAIGARTTESQVHRELASGLSMPVGFKNGTSGDIQIAVDAIRSSAAPHRFLSVTKQGLAAIVSTRGNPNCHVILRGGSAGPNYSEEAVNKACADLKKAGFDAGVMVDCSHANSNKDCSRQPVVAEALAEQVSHGNNVFGVMIESFIEAGRQNMVDRAELEYGKSITDGCISWAQTEPVLESLARAVRARRTRRS